MFLNFSKKHLAITSIFLFALTLIISGVVFWLNFTSSPEYTFYQVQTSIKNKDYQNFQKWSDSESIKNSYYNQITQTFKNKQGFDPESENIKNSISELADDFVKNEVENGKFFSSTEEISRRSENFATINSRNYNLQDLFFTSPLVKVDENTYYYFSLNKTLVFTKEFEGWKLTEIRNDFDDYAIPVPQEQIIDFDKVYTEDDIQIKVTEAIWVDDFTYSLPLTGENKIHPSQENQKFLLVKIELNNQGEESKYASFLNDLELHSTLQNKKHQPVYTGFNNSLEENSCLFCLLEPEKSYSDYLIFELKETDLNNLKLNDNLISFKLN